MKRIEWVGLAGLLVVLLSACTHLPGSGGATPKSLNALVLMTDFGLKDGAVSAMKGVAYQVSPNLVISDLTHEIPPYDIWQGAYRLHQTAAYWAEGTVFVTVVDPGVGSERKSIVAKSKSGKYFVGPDNGHLTLIAQTDPIVEVRVIDESKSRLKGSQESYTFHGRDLYVYVGAQLASGHTKFEDIGSVQSSGLVQIPYQKPSFENGVLKGTIPILDPNYGNVWTNLAKTEVVNRFGDAKSLKIKILNNQKLVYQAVLPLGATFAAVPKGQPLMYFNSLLDLAVALNQANFAGKYKIGSGPGWTIELQAK